MVGGYTLAIVNRHPGCAKCDGTMKVAVRTDLGVAGYLTSEYPWEADIPDAIDQHPSVAHHRMDWLAEDIGGTPLDVPTGTLHHAATRIAALAHRGLLEVRED